MPHVDFSFGGAGGARHVAAHWNLIHALPIFGVHYVKKFVATAEHNLSLRRDCGGAIDVIVALVGPDFFAGFGYEALIVI